jgi:hypothetical protein
MGGAVFMGASRKKILTIGTTKVKAAPKKSASDLWKPMPTLIYWNS